MVITDLPSDLFWIMVVAAVLAPVGVVSSLLLENWWITATAAILFIAGRFYLSHKRAASIPPPRPAFRNKNQFHRP